MEEGEQLCDRIAIMDNGEIIAAGTLEELLRLRVETIEIERPRGLEQLFLQLTGKVIQLPELEEVGMKKGPLSNLERGPAEVGLRE